MIPKKLSAEFGLRQSKNDGCMFRRKHNVILDPNDQIQLFSYSTISSFFAQKIQLFLIEALGRYIT